MNPEDVDLEDLIESSDSSADDLNVSSKSELADKVISLGSVKLDDEGRMLISCVGGSPARGRGNYICGIFPLPDPNGDGFKQVCTGPTMRYSDGKVYSGDIAFSSCPYNPGRLNDDTGSDDSDGGGLFGD
ncbi:hypothetical protein [Halovenus marina]|uniref:hypothetical protein n=1 Tax=Halovenus marina TaxID=3396621 RepID=UPI003F562656